MHGYHTNYRFLRSDSKLHQSFALESLKEEKYILKSHLFYLSSKISDLINQDNPFAAGCFNAINITSADYSAELDSRLTWSDKVTI